MTVRWIKAEYFPYLDADQVCEVLSIEKDWYRIMCNYDGSGLFPPDCFEIIDATGLKELQEEDRKEIWRGKDWGNTD